ncbi:2-oxoglutarate dehydrogenase, E2 component, dihydrolipoamide succinyltransferase [Cellulomonas fimi]|uniref:Dihydrolipoamide acetyltransferase component of pyruvate dehydrogenase complex n=2 Tax=Cellulomonas fimi TaxID=1708 RepID=F4H242_CELFA|nr:2-oxoglutarate dehydrogenase, E2 component, dihydrolipoamide succinyltransferase [Cellulomonas fimi]AEE46339.1 2-oxoglutarate dehydrogenase, E2 component, dihydrolipoamide succinyltransferase [Cellulomonas fimi ATCC 484]VEH32588.1 Dihydrolipoyllysine-residue succinyltransferase component of 2-oxoglutarate dehydrogenase complex [Cellulomonas fimi]
MSDNVQLPALGESVTEGTVTRWLKNVGDRVEVDEPLLEISTDKVDTEIPSPFAGVLEQILVQEDETVEVGATLAVIGSGEGAGGDGAAQDAAPQEAPAEQAPAEEPAAEAQPAQQPVEQHEEAAPAPAAEQPAEQPAAAQGSSGDGQEVTLPALGESVTEGTVTRWLKAVGDTVEVDEPLLEISTDKVDTEIPSPVAGTVQEIRVQEDETVEVGAVLAIVGSGAATPAAAPAPAAPAPAPAPQAEPAPVPATPAPAPAQPAAPQAGGYEAPAPEAESAQSAGQAPAAQQAAAQQPTASATTASAASAAGSYLTPLVRKLAAEKGVDVTTLTGTGVGGRIRKEDVLEAAAKAEAAKAAQAAPAAEAPAAAAPKAASVPSVSPLRGTTEKASRLRQIIAERMVEALHTQAQLTTVVEVDVTKVARLRARAKDDFKAREGVNLTFLPFFVQAAVESLKAYPKINGVLEGNQITYHGQENVAIAVDTERGLLTPVIRDAGDLNLAGIARKIADLAARTRANKVTPDELSGATFTVTNTGSGGALIDTPIVPTGTSAILGTGAIVKRPVVVKGADGEEVIAIRSMCYLCLSYDHRLVDGADASRYLSAVKARIEEGAFESEVGL